MTTDECIQDVSFTDCESSHVSKLCLQLNSNSDCIHVLPSMLTVMGAWLAKPGYALPQFNLANLYRKGQGMEQQDKTAVHWYRKATMQDFAPPGAKCADL